MSVSSCCSSCPSAPGTQARAAGASALPGWRSRALRACRPPTLLSCGPSPRQAARGAAATLSFAPGAGDWRTSRLSCPRTGTPVTSCRSPASATGSSGGQPRSGSSRWSPAAPSAMPHSSWESHQPATPCPATASTPEQATSTPGPGSSTARSASRTRWKPWHANSTTPQRRWSTTSPGARRCRPGASTRTPGRASPPAWPPPPAPSSPTSGTENASSPPSTSGSRPPLASTSSPRDPSRPSCPPASGSPGPSGQVHGNCWTPATPGLTTPA